MPGFCSHYLFYLDAIEAIEAMVDFPVCRDAVAIGSQGPDIFFFHKIYSIKNSKRAIGIKLHNSKPGDIFDSFGEYLRQNDNPVVKSYALGFMLHYCLDRQCHPFVFAKEKEITDVNKKIHHSSAHNQIEMAIDSYMLHKRLGIENVKDMDTASTINLSQGELEEIGKVIKHISKTVLDMDIDAQHGVDAIIDTKKLQSILRNKNGGAMVLAKTLETPVGKLSGYYKLSAMIKPQWQEGLKYANLDHNTWCSPYTEGHSSNESFEDLYQNALDERDRLLQGMLDIIAGNENGYNLTNNISFLNGREVK